MTRAFLILFFCASLTVAFANVYRNAPPSHGPSAHQAPRSPYSGARSSSSSASGFSSYSNNPFAALQSYTPKVGSDICASVNPTGQVRPPPRTPDQNAARKPLDQVDFARPTRQTFHNQFNNVDFVFDVANKQAPGQSLAGGTRQDVTVSDLPSLFNQRMSLALFTMEPCGINLPHTHPRATEMYFVIDADRQQVGFVEENGGRTIVNELKSGQMTFFPQGLLHYEINLSCRPSKLVAMLNHEDPGVLTGSTRLFDIPPLALDSTLAIDFDLAQQLRNGLSESQAGGRAECLKRCGFSPPLPTQNSTINFFTRS